MESTNWITLLSGLGLGALLVKIIDILWLKDLIFRQDSVKWLKDKQIYAFTDVVKELISFGLHENNELHSPFETYGAVSRALLLIDNDELAERIDHFVVDMNTLNTLRESGDMEGAQPLYDQLVIEARAITKELRKILLSIPKT
ncbi:MAG: hypothetical protein ABW094_09365 [Candidatus Thiodiazotropha sp.]